MQAGGRLLELIRWPTDHPPQLASATFLCSACSVSSREPPPSDNPVSESSCLPTVLQLIFCRHEQESYHVVAGPSKTHVAADALARMTTMILASRWPLADSRARCPQAAAGTGLRPGIMREPQLAPGRGGRRPLEGPPQARLRNGSAGGAGWRTGANVQVQLYLSLEGASNRCLIEDHDLSCFPCKYVITSAWTAHHKAS